MFELQTNYDIMNERIVSKVREYLNENHTLKSLVMGISGGIDSGLTCALAHDALASLPSVRLITRSLPIESNKETIACRVDFSTPEAV